MLMLLINQALILTYLSVLITKICNMSAAVCTSFGVGDTAKGEGTKLEVNFAHSFIHNMRLTAESWVLCNCAFLFPRHLPVLCLLCPWHDPPDHYHQCRALILFGLCA
jgi:hypothetical protein